MLCRALFSKHPLYLGICWSWVGGLVLQVEGGVVLLTLLAYEKISYSTFLQCKPQKCYLRSGKLCQLGKAHVVVLCAVSFLLWCMLSLSSATCAISHLLTGVISLLCQPVLSLSSAVLCQFFLITHAILLSCSDAIYLSLLLWLIPFLLCWPVQCLSCPDLYQFYPVLTCVISISQQCCCRVTSGGFSALDAQLFSLIDWPVGNCEFLFIFLSCTNLTYKTWEKADGDKQRVQDCLL